MITVRIPDDLKDRIDATRPSTVSREAWVRGALEAVLSEAKGALNPRQSGPAPVPSRVEPSAAMGTAGDGVRPAAQPRAHGKRSGSKTTADTGPPPGPHLPGEVDGCAVLPAVLANPGLRSNGHLPSCKCWRCERLDGAP